MVTNQATTTLPKSIVTILICYLGLIVFLSTIVIVALNKDFTVVW